MTIRGDSSFWVRVTVTTVAALAVLILAVVALIFFNQHSMIYHPRPYSAGYARALPSNGVEIEYVLPWGKQTAYYIPTSEGAPKRIWAAFCGNGSLALDWTGLVRQYPRNGDAFLLIDYPGYGRNSGYATIESTRRTSAAAFTTLANRLNIDEKQISLCVIGHSLGAAAALDFAAHHSVQRIVLISPFSSLREEGAYIFGDLLSRLLVENYDNRHNLKEVFQHSPRAKAAIFHGTADTVVPVRMGGELKQAFPAIDFFPIDGADHVTVLDVALEKIISWMN